MANSASAPGGISPTPGIAEVLEDLSPDLGGNLGRNGFIIEGMSIPLPSGIAAGYVKVSLVPLYEDNTGKVTSIIHCNFLSGSTVAITQFKKIGGVWMFDPDSCALDASVTLNATSATQNILSASAISNPAGSGDDILFIHGADIAGSPDDYAVDSIVLTPGGTLTATAVTIAGANFPASVDLIETINVPLSTSKMMVIGGAGEDDAHFADITESAGVYTFTFTDAKVTGIDADINLTPNTGAISFWGGFSVGTQVFLYKVGTASTQPKAFELTAAGVLTEKWNPISIGHDDHNGTVNSGGMGVAAVGGLFALILPGFTTSSSNETTYTMHPLDVDAI